MALVNHRVCSALKVELLNFSNCRLLRKMKFNILLIELGTLPELKSRRRCVYHLMSLVTNFDCPTITLQVTLFNFYTC